MKLETFLDKYGSTMGYLETIFLKNIYYKDYGEKGLDLITPEVNISRNDGSNRQWRIDFVIETKNNKYAIETDGYNYHAPGRVSKERFDELTIKTNEITKQGFYQIHLTRDQIEKEPNEAIYQIRRNINSDEELTGLFLNWSKDQKPKPHQIQIKALEALDNTRKKYKRGVVALATGLGKTYLSIFDTHQLKSKRILYIVHQDHILKQARNSFEKMMPERYDEMGFYTGKEKFNTIKKTKNINIIFSTIQTLTKNLEKFIINEFNYIIMDESHHTAAPSYTKVMNYFNPDFFLGLTATPERMDKKNILEFYQDNMVYQMDQDEAIKQGYLANLIYKGMIDNIDYTNISYNGFKYDVKDLNKNLIIDKRDTAIINKFKNLASNKKTIGFCASIEHANHCQKIFEKEGYKSISIHSKTSNNKLFKDEKTLIEKFTSSNYQIAFVVDMLNEGIDIPDVECILMLRPTESKTILKQQLGRGLRISPATNKRNLLVLDFIGNYKSSPEILDSFGLKITDLKFDKEKQVYYYDNNGQIVEFDEDVVDIFKHLKSTSTREVDESLITNEWKEYGIFLKENTAKGKNLFWNVGKKNNQLDVHLYILNEINININKFDTAKKLDEFVKKKTKSKYPRQKRMEGSRALLLSKFLGFLEENKIKLSKNGIKLIDYYKQQNINKVNELITNQIEKFIYWSDFFSLTDRHSGKRIVNEVFNLYPIFFLYQVIVKLNEFGYLKNEITKFEIQNFVIFCGNHSDLTDVIEKIIKYRNSNEIYELEKHLKKNNRMDSRIYNVLKNIKFFDFNSKKISIKNEFFKEIQNKVSNFEKLLSKNKITFFDKKNNDHYKKLLFDKRDLIKYFSTL